MNRICLVEDDPTIRELVGERLGRSGYLVDCFESGEGISDKALLTWDLFIVDVLYKGERAGFSLCARIRERSPAHPILILSALSEPGDRVTGLKLGADDYLVKPFEMEELLLRVEGMLKRRSWYGNLHPEQAVFRWGNNAVDFVKLEGTHGGNEFLLSPKECMLMKLLVERQGHVVSREEILDKVWGCGAFPSTRTVDNFVLRLRKYFEDEPSSPRYIQSVHGLGYRFAL